MPFAITISIVNLALYCLQQFGVAIAVGAETVLLVAFLQSIQDRMVDEEEKGFARATRKVMDFGLFFIITSGVGIVVVQFFSGQPFGLFSTVFLFKWSLIGIVLFMSFVNRGTSVTAGVLQGLAAGTWYALFVVHILAPQGTWLVLGEFYAAWLVGFMVCWTIVVFAVRLTHKTIPVLAKPASVPAPAVVVVPDRKAPAPAPTPVVAKVAPAPVVQPAPPAPPQAAPPPPPAAAPVAPPAPAVVMPPPITAPTPAPAPANTAPQPPAPPAPPAQPAKSAGAPEFLGLRVMPRTIEEVERHKQDPA
jgi:hypothetical protein